MRGSSESGTAVQGAAIDALLTVDKPVRRTGGDILVYRERNNGNAEA